MGTAVVGDFADRFVEADADLRGRGHGHPLFGHLGERGAQRQMHGVFGAERPADPPGPADRHVHRHGLAGSQPLSRRQAPVVHRYRDAVTGGPERFDVLDRPAQRLHRHAREGRGIAGQRCAREHERRDHHGDQHDRRTCCHAEQCASPAMRNRYGAALSGPNRHRYRIRRGRERRLGRAHYDCES